MDFVKKDSDHSLVPAFEARPAVNGGFWKNHFEAIVNEVWEDFHHRGVDV
jgi:hypothetical protein